jgi:hypothetical protein
MPSSYPHRKYRPVKAGVSRRRFIPSLPTIFETTNGGPRLSSFPLSPTRMCKRLKQMILTQGRFSYFYYYHSSNKQEQQEHRGHQHVRLEIWRKNTMQNSYRRKIQHVATKVSHKTNSPHRLPFFLLRLSLLDMRIILWYKDGWNVRNTGDPMRLVGYTERQGYLFFTSH